MAKRQQSIPGIERKANREINDAAENYVEQRDKRMKLSEYESEAKEALIAVLKKSGISVYRDDDADPPLVITLSTKDNVKVSEVESDDEEWDDTPNTFERDHAPSKVSAGAPAAPKRGPKSQRPKKAAPPPPPPNPGANGQPSDAA